MNSFCALSCIFLVSLAVTESLEIERHRLRRSAPDIADQAEALVGSTAWSKENNLHGAADQWKCNMFVADVVKMVYKSVPHRHWWTYSPIGAWEWADPFSDYLTDSCWRLTADPSRGDVAAFGGHVGIVTQYGETVSAAEYEVVQNDWGFRDEQHPIFWEYMC